MKRSAKSYVKDQIRSVATIGLSFAKFFPTILTPREEVERLIHRLHPVTTNAELVRLGPDADGGYLLPNDLDGINACFSPGVSFESRFEKDCADRGMKVFLADKSVDGPGVNHPLFKFTKKFVGAVSNNDFMTMDNWVKECVPDDGSDLLLQIDIEGFEYEVFLSMTDQLMKRFRIIVAEFHDLNQFWNKPFFNLASHTFEKILQTHTCIHIHPNNGDYVLTKSGLTIPHVMEFTFFRNDRIKSKTPAKVFPHPLDVDNTDEAHLVLPSCWYKS